MEPENLLKGRIAESLVEELLKRSGNRVYRFGYEAVLQNLTQLEESFDRESEVGQRISSIPDFIAVKGKKILFVEVKFRTDPSFFKKDINKLRMIGEFWRAKIVLVTLVKPYFRVFTSSYIAEGRRLDSIPIEKDPDLGVTPDVLNKFNELVEKYYPIKEKDEEKNLPF